MKPEINSLYVYDSKVFPILSHRQQPEGMEYSLKERHSLKKVAADTIHRYAQTFSIDDVKKTLIMITDEDDLEKVSMFFLKSMDQIKKNPKLSMRFKSAVRIPSELGILFE